MLTIPTKEPWVPLRILSLGLDKTEVVEADVFLLTDTQPKLLAGGPGLSLERNEPASASLLDDLRSDKGMELGAADDVVHLPAASMPRPVTLDYDLAICDAAERGAELADTGVTATRSPHDARRRATGTTRRWSWPAVVGARGRSPRRSIGRPAPAPGSCGAAA